MLHFAHSLKEKPKSEWHRLDQHLRTTAERAERFAAPFAKGWGHLAGLWHDADKYQQAFQDYLAQTGDPTPTKVDHSTVGALIALNKRAGPLTFVVAGHHGGLPNKLDLKARLEKKHELLNAARESGMPAELRICLALGQQTKVTYAGCRVRINRNWMSTCFDALDPG